MFIGSMARLPDDAPTKLFLNELRTTRAKNFRRGQKLIWLKQIESEVEVKLLDID